MSDHNQPMTQGNSQSGGSINMPSQSDFSNSQECAAYLSALADNLHIAAARVDLAKAAALQGDTAKMDEHLARTDEPLKKGNYGLKTIRHERAHFQSPDEERDSHYFWPYPSRNDLPEVPPSHFAVLMRQSGEVRILSADEWEVAKTERAYSQFYDVSLIGHEHDKYDWVFKAGGQIVAFRKMA